MTEIRLVSLAKKFGNTTAVDNVSLEIKDGDFVVLLGPSGCGKTTTLRCIAGLEEPDSGDIFIGETLVNDEPPRDRDVAMVFQNYALYPHMSVFDNIGFPLKMRKVPKEDRRRRVEATAKLLKIEHLLKRKPKQLSGGEQQRVALARALVRNPKAFLMDEPLSNLDAKLRLHTRAEIKRLHSELRVTTVYVTHDQAEALSMADKIAIMNNGKVLQYADPITVYNQPATTFVAGFIGSPAMNLISVKAAVDGSNIVLSTSYFSLGLAFPNPSIKVTDKALLMGVRPEHLPLSLTKNDDSVFEAEVYVVEPLGSNTLVDLKVDGEILKAVYPGEFTAAVGGKVWVEISPERVHLFEEESGNLIF